MPAPKLSKSSDPPFSKRTEYEKAVKAHLLAFIKNLGALADAGKPEVVNSSRRYFEAIEAEAHELREALLRAQHALETENETALETEYQNRKGTLVLMSDSLETHLATALRFDHSGLLSSVDKFVQVKNGIRRSAETGRQRVREFKKLFGGPLKKLDRGTTRQFGLERFLLLPGKEVQALSFLVCETTRIDENIVTFDFFVSRPTINAGPRVKGYIREEIDVVPLRQMLEREGQKLERAFRGLHNFYGTVLDKMTARLKAVARDVIEYENRYASVVKECQRYIDDLDDEWDKIIDDIAAQAGALFGTEVKDLDDILQDLRKQAVREFEDYRDAIAMFIEQEFFNDIDPVLSPDRMTLSLVEEAEEAVERILDRADDLLADYTAWVDQQCGDFQDNAI